jgi:transposase
VESTYNWYWLVDGLMDAGYEAHLVNTSAVKRYEGLKYTDDRHDARWLARLLALGILPEGYIYPKQERPLRDLLRRRGFLVRKRTSHLLAMRAVCERETGVRPSGNELKRWTCKSLEARIGDPRVALNLTSLLHVARVLTAQVERIEASVLKEAELREEFQLLQTIPGLGKVLALTIMYEVGDIRRFSKVGRFASYCRCVKSEYTSDGKRKGSGNRRNGNPYLSWAFSEVAHHAARWSPRAKRFYERKCGQTHKIVANRALANKMARASYYIMRDQVPFDAARAFG